MEYFLSDINEIKAKVHTIIDAEIDNALEKGTINIILEQLKIECKKEWTPSNIKKSKILVFGTLAGKKNKYIGVAKELGIPKDNIEFIDDYKELKRIDVSKYKNSEKYSDIIYGSVPHKQVGMGDTSSFLETIKREPENYPRLTIAIANSKLKITKTSFEEALKKTNLFENINVNMQD